MALSMQELMALDDQIDRYLEKLAKLKAQHKATKSIQRRAELSDEIAYTRILIANLQERISHNYDNLFWQ